MPPLEAVVFALACAPHAPVVLRGAVDRQLVQELLVRLGPLGATVLARGAVREAGGGRVGRLVAKDSGRGSQQLVTGRHVGHGDGVGTRAQRPRLHRPFEVRPAVDRRSALRAAGYHLPEGFSARARIEVQSLDRRLQWV